LAGRGHARWSTHFLDDHIGKLRGRQGRGRIAGSAEIEEAGLTPYRRSRQRGRRTIDISISKKPLASAGPNTIVLTDRLRAQRFTP
jgi:hypothetical protein